MRIFLTGATGFIGSAVVRDLIGAGHQVLGMTRSDSGAETLEGVGAEAWYGDLNDLDSLGEGAGRCDAVIHTAFDHDFSNFVANCDKDRRAILALGSALAGSQRPLVVTSVTAMGTVDPGKPAIEDHFDADHPNPRSASEKAGRMLIDRGINVSFVRLSQIHDTRKQGLVTELIALARSRGVSAMVGDGANLWSAAHVGDTARLYRLAVECPVSGASYHAVAEEGIAVRDIAAAIGDGLNIPVVSLTGEEAKAHFGWLALFADRDMPASSAATRQRMGWAPVGPGLIDDLRAMDYAA